MTKQDITDIITNNIMTQLQKPKDALTTIAETYASWLRGTVKRAQEKAVLSLQTSSEEPAAGAAQPQAQGVS